MDDDRFYQLMEIYRNPEHQGELEDFDRSSEGYSSSCGDRFKVFIKLEKGRIKNISFRGDGCVVSTVSISKVCGYVIGKTAQEVEKMDIEDIKDLIGIQNISVSRVKCATIGLETIKQALLVGHQADL
ncbi:iron-sulfur cluster assembly scaffold protein [Candidatus Parvarchaeota archaeon]|nr:iron-sulfur cluster assembly scaffold protein [Candidatus Parvarchaeota archaeon]